jgi:dolichyl-phosphate-mannose-protein mannosyltransferase
MASLLEVSRTWRPTREQWGLAAALVVALVLRVAAVTGRGHTGDLFALSQWAEGMAANGPSGYYASGGNANYPPLLYLLWPLGAAFDGRDLQTAIRVLSIPFDLALGVLIFGLVRWAAARTGPRLAKAEWTGVLAAGFYLLNPAVIVSGPLWGQVDGIGALPMLGALAALASGRVATASVLATLAGLIKPQFGIAAFVLAGILLIDLRRPDGVRTAAIAGLAAIATFGIVMIPLGLGPTAYLHLLSITADRYPFYSLFGFNPWAMVFGFGAKDGGAFQVGVALAGIAILLSLALLWRRRDLVGLLGVAALIALVLYFVPTRVHERYLFGAIVLLAPQAALAPRLRVPFVVLSGLFLATLLYTLGNAPVPGVPLPDWARGNLAPWEIWLTAGLVTLAGVWCAWEVVGLFRLRSAAQPAESVRSNAM